MSTNTIILIAGVAVVAVLIAAALAWVASNKRKENRRVEAADIRTKAAEQSHKVGQREARAAETAAKARGAQAEADAKAAEARGLQHQAQARQTDAASHRDKVNEEFDRADKIDPDSQTPPTTHDERTPVPSDRPNGQPQNATGPASGTTHDQQTRNR